MRLFTSVDLEIFIPKNNVGLLLGRGRVLHGSVLGADEIEIRVPFQTDFYYCVPLQDFGFRMTIKQYEDCTVEIAV